jgi:hypothetical protein
MTINCCKAVRVGNRQSNKKQLLAEVALIHHK